MDPRTQLYTRSQVASLTGVDDTSLNYWMREGILRAKCGGGGKGQHRRFPYTEVNLAALFGQLRQFGVSMPSLRQIAERFHAAVDYMAALGRTPRVDDGFDTLLSVRRSIERNGYLEWRIRTDEGERYQAVMPWIFDLAADDQSYPHLGIAVRMDWTQALAFYRGAPEVWHRARGTDEVYTDALVTLVESVNLAEHDGHSIYWEVATLLGETAPPNTTPHLFYREESGGWAVSVEGGNMPSVESFVGVNMELVANRMWGGVTSTVGDRDQSCASEAIS